MIRFNCSSCGKLVEVSDQHAGKKGKCPHCQMLMEIPRASAAEGTAAEEIKPTVAETPAASKAAPPPTAEPQTEEAPQDNVAAPPGAWYYAISGQRQGPVSATALVAQIQAGQLPPTVQVWRSGMDNWAPANTLAEFQQVAAPTAIVPQAAALPAAITVPPVGQLVQAGTAAARMHQLSTFPVAVVILLHYVTFGIFTTIWLNLMHGKMPKIRHDDPSAGKAIGFLFIPFFNLYWVFFTYCRLCDRINEQRQNHGLPPSVPKGLAIAVCIVMLIPYVGILCWLILAPIFAGIMQAKVNELVRHTAAGPATAVAW